MLLLFNQCAGVGLCGSAFRFFSAWVGLIRVNVFVGGWLKAGGLLKLG